MKQYKKLSQIFPGSEEDSVVENNRRCIGQYPILEAQKLLELGMRMGIEIQYYNHLSDANVLNNQQYLKIGYMCVTAPETDLSNFWKKYREENL